MMLAGTMPQEPARSSVRSDLYNHGAMNMHEVLAGLRQLEIEIDREETIELLCHRHRLQRDVAVRIVQIARDVDQAHAIAELMR